MNSFCCFRATKILLPKHIHDQSIKFTRWSPSMGAIKDVEMDCLQYQLLRPGSHTLDTEFVFLPVCHYIHDRKIEFISTLPLVLM